MTSDVFLSYRRTDQALARALVGALEQRGVAVWWDQEIEGGENWREAIVEGLSAAHTLVILFSEACNKSKQLKKELAIADTLDKEIVPILIENTQPKGHYLYELAARNWLQVFPEPERKINDLADRLARELADNRPASAAPRASAAPPSGPPGQESMVGSAPPPAGEAAPLEAETVEKVVQATQRSERARQNLRDTLPFKWYEVVIALVIAALTAFGRYDLDTEAWDAPATIVTLDALGMFFLSLLVIAMIVFPFRYYFRRRRVWRAARAYMASVLILAVLLGLVFGVHPEIIDETLGAGENLIVMLIGSIIVFGGIAVITFGIYGLLHFQRTVRSFNRNVEAI